MRNWNSTLVEDRKIRNNATIDDEENKMMQIIDYGDKLEIDVPYDRWFRRNVDAIKALPKRRWDYQSKRWIIPNEMRPQVIGFVKSHHANMIDIKKVAPESIGIIEPLPDLDVELPVKATLRPYQKKGIARAMELRRVLIGDEPGLGKTIQSLSAVIGLNGFPCLVICPSSTKINWQREWHKFSSKKAMVLTDRVKNTWQQYYKVGMVDVFITNYESLKKYFVDYLPEKKNLRHSKQIRMKETIHLFKSIIIDESHRCKNTSTLQAKLCMQIAWRKDNIILLSGTPVINKPIDLYPQLAIMNQLEHFGGTRKAFVDRYCEGGNGASNLRELNYLLNKYCFFRREKKDVAKDLPEKDRQMVVCDISTRSEYNHARDEFARYLKENGCTDREVAKKLRGEIMVKMGLLKQISARGKMQEVKGFVEEILDSGEKLVLFCNLHEIVDGVLELFPSAVTLTGRDSMDTRQKNIDAFQNDKDCQLIVCNIKAAGVGITLTASSRVAFIEFPWTYADCVQAEDRCHRIGQTVNVMCTYFLGQNTIDERLFELILEKKDVANTITGATDDMKMDTINKVLDLFNI